MAHSTLIRFDRSLSGAVVVGEPGRAVGERELIERVAEAYRRGCDDTRASADHQMVEARADIQGLSEGLLRELAGIESSLLQQIRQSLPDLGLEIARRLLAGFEPSPEIIERLCAEALDQLFPEREGLELSVCPRDAAMLETANPDWHRRYPGLRICPDATLSTGDCVVRSRFGVTDARRRTKLAALEHGLVGA